MYEFHGWVNIVADDAGEPESSVLQARHNELIAALEDRGQAHRPLEAIGRSRTGVAQAFGDVRNIS